MDKSEISDTKRLVPLKAIIHGPPAAGKTTLAKRLCNRYGAHYVSVKSMIDETLAELRDNIEREKERVRLKSKKTSKEKKEEDDEDEEDVVDEENIEEEEEGGDVEDWQEHIKDITMLMAKGERNRLPDDYVVRMMKDFLAKDICQHRGYVLDGYPKTIEQAHELFGQAAEIGAAPEEEQGGGAAAGDETAGEGAGEGGPAPTAVGGLLGNASDLIMPQFVIALEGTENMLCERVMRLPQRYIQGTHYDEINMLRRLAEFRTNNAEDVTVLKFFDEVGTHPFLVALVDEETRKERDPDYIFEFVCAMIGDPIPGFGLSPEEEETIRRLENEQRRLQEEAGRLERQLIEEKALREHEMKMERWAETFEKLQMEEEKIIVAQSEPLRFYLMKYVFPTLTKGLIEVAKLKPGDPVDYLAEFLFRENPEGKMFDPSYTRDGERILKYYEKEVAPEINKTLNK